MSHHIILKTTAALACLLAANTSIYFPAGSYTQASRIDMKRGWVLHGDGKDNSLIKSSIAGTASGWT